MPIGATIPFGGRVGAIGGMGGIGGLINRPEQTPTDILQGTIARRRAPFTGLGPVEAARALVPQGADHAS